ncbi:hypothetical protein [Flexithrix dorotheae]|uniref:hypothetical protein n=1 Tax=Flexithrix dorotheae TaxID=70993 RepID=UPI00037D8224|nr:hypothetical protein [Flexithrix dorotheae]
MRVNKEIASNFVVLQRELPKILKSYGLTAAYIARKIEMPHATFYRKMRNLAFSGLEMEKICEEINR